MKALTGKQLRIAAEKGLKVKYIEHYYNPMDSHMNYNDIYVMTKANTGYYIGNSDIDPEEWDEDQEVEGDFPEGTFGVYAVKGIKYK